MVPLVGLDVFHVFATKSAHLFLAQVDELDVKQKILLELVHLAAVVATVLGLNVRVGTDKVTLERFLALILEMTDRALKVGVSVVGLAVSLQGIFVEILAATQVALERFFVSVSHVFGYLIRIDELLLTQGTRVETIFELVEPA